jgi:uncharacterized membrane protein
MIQSADSYIPQSALTGLRRKAWWAWAAGLAIVSLWAFLILVPPVAKEQGFLGLSATLYHFFGYLCHQIPARSFYIAGEPFGVCSRCFGVYLGLVVGFAIYPFWRNLADIEPLPKFWLFLSLIPITIDWSLTVFHVWENTHLSRLITGLILGIACATYIVPAMVEIGRNLGRRRRTFVDSPS